VLYQDLGQKVTFQMNGGKKGRGCMGVQKGGRGRIINLDERGGSIIGWSRGGV